mgnify:CR=1 FL=1
MRNRNHLILCPVLDGPRSFVGRRRIWPLCLNMCDCISVQVEINRSKNIEFSTTKKLVAELPRNW